MRIKSACIGTVCEQRTEGSHSDVADTSFIPFDGIKKAMIFSTESVD